MAFLWCHRESNQGHKDFQSFALPTELWHQILFRTTLSFDWDCKDRYYFLICKLFCNYSLLYLNILFLAVSKKICIFAVAMGCRTYISVILPLRLEWEPCYFVPADLMSGQSRDLDAETPSNEEEVVFEQKCSDKKQTYYKTRNSLIGKRVKVNFSGKDYVGVIGAIDVTPDTEISRIKPIKAFEEGLGDILPQEIELWRQIAGYYLCTVGEVYKAAYPIGKIDLEESRAAAKQKAEERKARKREALMARISKIEERIGKKRELLAKARKDSTREAYTQDIERLEREMAFFKSALDPEWAEGDSMHGIAEKTGISDGADGNIQPYNGISSANTPTLTPAQQNAADEIKRGFASAKPVLLNGVTGSGKTEIYISLALEAMKQGRNVLYLVPEISLSRQLEERLEKYFGDSLMSFHSRETAASKRNTAEKITELKSSKGNYIVLGTRSSLFLPHHNLGLIIVDEEHDTSYKQDSPAPRYNGRDTALILSIIHRSNVILGSATPSLEELYNCSTGRHVQVILNERFHGSDDSEIEIIDTRAERRKNGMKGSFSRKLIAQIEDTLSKGEQVIILRARRSWAPIMQCETCGEIQRCPHCNVAMSLHIASSGQGMTHGLKTGIPHTNPDYVSNKSVPYQTHTGRMVCHWCGYKVDYTGHCSKCGGTLSSFGAGTQKIEEEAATLFPTARIARLDSDTVQNRNFEKKTIKEFSEGKIDILIGTQIVTKGFDFSKLSLVAVIAADSLLGVQDFRADEKALQLLQQLRGRCGRRSQRGRFVIQTAQPEHPIYTNLSNIREGNFSFTLLQERQDFGYPPYSRIVEIEIKDTFEDRAERMAGRLRRKFGNLNITGPYKPSVSKVADKHIQMLRISLAKDRNLKRNKENIRNTILNFEKENRYDGHITINVDPS